MIRQEENQNGGGAMLINEVCKKCSLTKKAVEYYVEQGLIAPAVRENGYRDFSEEDVSMLQKISVLRGLGLSVKESRSVLTENGTDRGALTKVLCKKALQVTALQERQALISELAARDNWEETEEKLLQLQKKEKVSERILRAFPGNYGKYICLHFAVYLDEPIVTNEQQEAYETVISFLDGISLELPDNLQKYLDEATAHFDEEFAGKVAAKMDDMVFDTEKYIADNQEFIENWIAFKQSEEYRNSPAYLLAEALRQFNSASGYNEVFIPAMCRLSKSYRKYNEALQKADEKFLQKYPSCKPEPSSRLHKENCSR